MACDIKCENAKSCNDSDNWIALPKSLYASRKCGQDLVVCANGKSTHVKVRDKSEREAWEVNHGVQDDLMFLLMHRLLDQSMEMRVIQVSGRIHAVNLKSNKHQTWVLFMLKIS